MRSNCGRGRRTRWGWCLELTFAEAVRFARKDRGVQAQQGDYLVLQLGRKVDVITMWDTIEHLKRPDLFIAKAARDLKRGGIIALTTGDIGSVNARLRGRRWR